MCDADASFFVRTNASGEIRLKGVLLFIIYNIRFISAIHIADCDNWLTLASSGDLKIHVHGLHNKVRVRYHSKVKKPLSVRENLKAVYH